MKLKPYLVVLFPDSVLSDEDVNKQFERKNFPLAENAWIVGSDATTSQEIAERLGISVEPEASRTGAVFKLSTTDYCGYGPRTLWALLDAWENADD